jgi:hypothetical protein
LIGRLGRVTGQMTRLSREMSIVAKAAIVGDLAERAGSFPTTFGDAQGAQRDPSEGQTPGGRPGAPVKPGYGSNPKIGHKGLPWKITGHTMVHLATPTAAIG